MRTRFRHLKITAFLLWAASATLAGGGTAQTYGWPPPGNLTLPLWPGIAPQSVSNPAPERDITTVNDELVAGRPVIRLTNVSEPTLTVYKPKSKTTGAGVVVFPGGGYSILAIDLEGTEVCDWLNSVGVTCVLLKYRVPNSGPYPKSVAALEDAQRALRLVRLHASEWGMDQDRVGVLGFSAGAHLAVALSNHFDDRLYKPVDVADSLSCRPDFAALVYPAYLVQGDHSVALNLSLRADAKTPSTLILQTEDDPLDVNNAIAYFAALKNARIPAELHIYSKGGHGYGLRQTSLPITHWPMLLYSWLQTIKVLPLSAESRGQQAESPKLSSRPDTDRELGI